MQKLLQKIKRSYFRAFLVAAALITPVAPGAVNIAYAQSSWIDSSIGWLLATIADFIFYLIAWVTLQIGNLLDFTVQYFVLEMAEKINQIGAIENLWQIFRDLGNIAFIGVLLYIAIRTILDVGNTFNTKQLLIRLVIVALFVNFSLFATKVVIDTSNVVALQFYNNIQVEDCGEAECNISHFFASATNISSVQSTESIRGRSEISGAKNQNFRVALARILGAVFLAVTAFVMGAMAFLLVIRFGVLILLMIASPLAFIAFILPSVSWGEEWLDKLLSQSFFAPALFAMIYVVAHLASGLQNGIASEGNTDLMAAIMNPEGGQDFGVIMVFLLMTMLMAATLVVAKSMGAEGASKTIKWGKGARDWGQAKIVGGAGAAVRGSVGKIGQAADKKFKKTRFAQGYYGSKLRDKTTKKAAEAKFGTKKSAKGIAKEKKKAKSRVASYDAREEARKEIEQADNDAAKRRALSQLSSREKIDYGKKFLKEHAGLLSESDIKAIDNHDDFSERDKQEIKNNRYQPITDIAEEAAEADDEDTRKQKIGEIKATLGPLSENEIKNNINIDIQTGDEPDDPEEREEYHRKQNRNHQIIEAMSDSQFDNFRKTKSKDEKERLDEMRTQELANKISSNVENAVGEYLGGKKKDEIVSLLKRSDNETRTDPKVVDHITSEIFNDLSKELKEGDKDNLQNAIIDRATDPEHEATEKNKNTASHLMYGPGRATS